MTHLVMKLRMVRFLRTPEYDELFSPATRFGQLNLSVVWALTAVLLVTKNSFRFLNTLYIHGSFSGTEHHRSVGLKNCR
ncbi:formate acetyltransferase 1 [Salmonella bongori]|nr:formate acetyltransferase 1 [Salmonella bongori]